LMRSDRALVAAWAQQEPQYLRRGIHAAHGIQAAW
jgi:hypothetical protein